MTRYGSSIDEAFQLTRFLLLLSDCEVLIDNADEEVQKDEVPEPHPCAEEDGSENDLHCAFFGRNDGVEDVCPVLRR